MPCLLLLTCTMQNILLSHIHPTVAYSLFMYHSATGFLSNQEFAQTFPHDGTCLQLAFTFNFFSVDFSTESCPNFFCLPIIRKCLLYWNRLNFFSSTLLLLKYNGTVLKYYLALIFWISTPFYFCKSVYYNSQLSKLSYLNLAWKFTIFTIIFKSKMYNINNRVDCLDTMGV